MAARIFVVDDDSLVTESLATALRLETDWEVLAWNDPRAALAAMESAPPDVVISDLKMPGLSGLGFLAEVGQRHPDSVRILLTGYADKESAVRAINEVGLWQYVEKPWDTDDLLLKIRQGLDRRALTVELRRRNAELAQRVAELETAHERLVAAERLAAVGRVVSGIAHELGNQLGVLGYAEAIVSLTTEPAIRESAEAIVAAQRRLYGLIDEIRDFVRGTDPAYPREPVDLARIVEEALGILRWDREVQSRRLERRFSGRPLVSIHRGKIIQVVVNLVRNAAQASPSGGLVEVTVDELADGGGRLQVVDHGTGMSEEVRRHLGEPFFTTKRGGSGLGLGISRRIVDEHGGTLRVESAVGQGTTVEVTLPAAGPAA